MLIMLPPIVLPAQLLDYLLFAYRNKLFSKAPGTGQNGDCQEAETAQPRNSSSAPAAEEDITYNYRLINQVGDFAQVAGTSLLLVVVVWEFFDGVEVARKATGYRARFLWFYYLSGWYATLLKTSSIILVVSTSTAIGCFTYLRLLSREPKDTPQVSAIPAGY